MKWLEKFRSKKYREKKEGKPKPSIAKSVSLSVAESTHQQILGLVGDITSKKNDLNRRADMMVDSIQGVTKLMEKEGDRLSIGRR